MRLARTVDHPEFGKAQACECQREAQEERVARQLRRLSNLGPLEGVRLDAAEPLDEARELVCRFADEAAGETWLTLRGAAGTGRTRLAAEAANRRLAAGRTAVYFVAADLLDRLRSSQRREGELSYELLFDHVRDTEFLIVDDLDRANPTEWAREKMFQLLNHRWNRGLRTLLIVDGESVDRLGLGRFQREDEGAAAAVVELRAPVSERRYRQIGGMTEEALRRHTFRKFYPHLGGDGSNLAMVKGVVEEWARDPIGWLTLIGGTGTGKTHLSAAAAAARLDAGDVVAFTVVPELLDVLRRAYGLGEAASDGLFDELCSAPILVLDDLGAQVTTEWAAERVYQLIATRYVQRLPTLITTNLELDDLDPRIASRMADQQTGQVLRIRALDIRAGNATNTLIPGQGRRGWRKRPER